jgi:hypothetical protein
MNIRQKCAVFFICSTTAKSIENNFHISFSCQAQFSFFINPGASTTLMMNKLLDIEMCNLLCLLATTKCINNNFYGCFFSVLCSRQKLCKYKDIKGKFQVESKWVSGLKKKLYELCTRNAYKKDILLSKHQIFCFP